MRCASLLPVASALTAANTTHGKPSTVRLCGATNLALLGSKHAPPRRRSATHPSFPASDLPCSSNAQKSGTRAQRSNSTACTAPVQAHTPHRHTRSLVALWRPQCLSAPLPSSFEVRYGGVGDTHIHTIPVWRKARTRRRSDTPPCSLPAAVCAPPLLLLFTTVCPHKLHAPRGRRYARGKTGSHRGVHTRVHGPRGHCAVSFIPSYLLAVLSAVYSRRRTCCSPGTCSVSSLSLCLCAEHNTKSNACLCPLLRYKRDTPARRSLSRPFPSRSLCSSSRSPRAVSRSRPPICALALSTSTVFPPSNAARGSAALTTQPHSAQLHEFSRNTPAERVTKSRLATERGEEEEKLDHSETQNHPSVITRHPRIHYGHLLYPLLFIRRFCSAPLSVLAFVFSRSCLLLRSVAHCSPRLLSVAAAASSCRKCQKRQRSLRHDERAQTQSIKSAYTTLRRPTTCRRGINARPVWHYPLSRLSTTAQIPRFLTCPGIPTRSPPSFRPLRLPAGTRTTRKPAALWLLQPSVPPYPHQHGANSPAPPPESTAPSPTDSQCQIQSWASS